MPEEDTDDAITREEIAGTASPSDAKESPRTSKNAFTELMSHKRKTSPHLSSPSKKSTSTQSATSSSTTTTTTTTSDASSNAIHGRNALIEYINHPTRFPPSRVISHSEHFVAIHDLYPKSSVHLLLLPRHPSKYLLHPFDALSDLTFLASIRLEATKLKTLAAAELRRRYTRFSAQDTARNAALSADPAPSSLPPGRDWSADILVGVHAHPSMNHLHIHIISIDRVSECMRHRKHYNSFATPFFVPLDAFPLAADDVRRHPGREGYLDRDLVCWRCRKGFGNKFKLLKGHLEEEFEMWKRL